MFIIISMLICLCFGLAVGAAIDNLTIGTSMGFFLALVVRIRISQNER